MNAPSPRPNRRGILAALIASALLAIPMGFASPSQAAPPALPIAKYVALGDSIAAGQGAGVPLDSCLRTGAGYANLLDDQPRINLLRNAGCSGASITDVVEQQLGQLNQGTTLVTITAGAGDLQIGAVYAACVPDPQTPACAAAYGAAQQVLASGVIGPRMAALIAAAHERAPRAQILVTGYPVPFDLAVPGFPTAIDQAVIALNGFVGGAATGAAASGAPVSFVPVAEAFAGHGAASGPAAWIGADPADPVTFLHPNAAGYDAYAELLHSAYLEAAS
ncbi:SGNH/GDSL hydrolase family protein [Agromyces sp. NPDC055658]